MKKRTIKNIIIATLSFGYAVNAAAIGNGFYIGLMFGPASNSNTSKDAQINPSEAPFNCQSAPDPTECVKNFGLKETLVNARHNQFATRIFMGNKFNTYAAIEGGLTFISTIKYKSPTNTPTYGASQRIRALDVVGKGIFPLGSVFDIYGKLGITASYLTTGAGFNPTFDVKNNKFSGSNTYRNKFAPTYSLGVSYDINQSWVTDLSYNTIIAGGSFGSVTYYALALSYHFTDKYCGQFLCDD